MALVGCFWSGGQEYQSDALYYADIHGQHLPVNYRIYDKSEDKTKNDYFLEMLAEMLTWGLKPAFAIGDSGYSCTANLKTVKKPPHGILICGRKQPDSLYAKKR